MRIGFSSIYSWRPHVEHLHYLAELMREGGHNTSFLTCDSDLSTCYTRELHPERSTWMHCARCRIGGVRSYASKGVTSIGALTEAGIDTSLGDSEWSRSSASTLGRFESDADFGSMEFVALARRLDPPTRKAHTAALRWIERERLDAICLFNGRMDATRGVLEAAKIAGIPFVSLERTWFGDGLLLLPGENCLGLRNVDRMMTEWRDIPLTHTQALRTASHIASRFLRRNGKEWRAYNLSARAIDWPQSTARRRILLVPSSRNEVWGHPDCTPAWSEPILAFDALIEHLGLAPTDLVLRCHPNWGERIGRQDGRRAERYYSDWARKRGIHVITSTDATSTLGLIEQCDAIVVSGGSAALEAGILGKQVIAVGPSMYQEAGFQSNAYTTTALGELTLHVDLDKAQRHALAEQIARQTLRFVCTMVYRIPQFVDQVRCITTTRYEYRAGADPARLTALLLNGSLRADDDTRAIDSVGEDSVLALIAARDWEALFDAAPHAPQAAQIPVQRRWMFRPVDRIRESMPRGDL